MESMSFTTGGLRRLVRRKLTLKSLSTSLVSCLFIMYIILSPAGEHLYSGKYSDNESPYVFITDPSEYIHVDDDACQQYANLVGREHVKRTPLNLSGLVELPSFSDIRPGGTYIPASCDIMYKVAIIIPYRDRKKHLIQYIYNVVPKLKRHGIHFTIFVVEQAAGSSFNRGLMRNIGFQEARKLQKFDCYIFNDVDTIPEDDRNIFKCNNTNVRHMLSAVDRYNYTLPYPELFGGIVAFNEEQFRYVNGYSNLFFVWGGEDDDLFRRVVRKGMLVERTKHPFGIVSTLKHKHDALRPVRLAIYKTVEYTADHDGLNSLMYKTLEIEQKRLFTWIYVDIDERSIKRSYMRKFLQLYKKGQIKKSTHPFQYEPPPS